MSKTERGEVETKWVVVLTSLVMIVEIVTGYRYGSMALSADGWHMGTHASALAISALAYVFARKYADDERFSFGTGKLSALAGFGSAVLLAAAALLMLSESLFRVLSPKVIIFDQALVVAVIGLVANLVSAYLLRSGGGFSEEARDECHHHHDHNLKAAYLHVLSDALTSCLAIVALFGGKFFGWVWMDPCMAIVGAIVILRWSYGLLWDSGGMLMDAGVDRKVVTRIKDAIEAREDNRVCDIHVWRIGTRHLAAIVSLVTKNPKPPSHYKELIADLRHIRHLAVEVNECESLPLP